MEDSQLSKQCGPFWADVERENLKRMKKKNKQNQVIRIGTLNSHTLVTANR